MGQMLRKLAYSLMAVTAVYLVLLLWPANNRVADIPFYADNAFNVIAHGNGRALSPGNTLEAAVTALSVGADILELDIHLTADNILVVRHDETIDSTTNGSGRIAEMTLAELSRYEVGFHKYDYPDKVAERGIRIPTLESLFQRFPHNRFLIELKPWEQRRVRRSANWSGSTNYFIRYWWVHFTLLCCRIFVKSVLRYPHPWGKKR